MFLSAHVLVRILVAEQAGVDLEAVDVLQHCDRCGGPHGRPAALVRGKPGPEVSISHADGVVAAALSERPVGVDLQRAGAVGAEVATLVLAPGEQAHLSAGSPDADALTRTWVRKEAVLKAAATGFQVDPRELVLGPPSDPPRVVRWTRPGPWAIADLVLDPGFVAAVAVRAHRLSTVVARRLDLTGLS
jgi:4'-phosphopantetheinyl transferase